MAKIKVPSTPITDEAIECVNSLTMFHSGPSVTPNRRKAVAVADFRDMSSVSNHFYKQFL